MPAIHRTASGVETIYVGGKNGLYSFTTTGVKNWHVPSARTAHHLAIDNNGTVYASLIALLLSIAPLFGPAHRLMEDWTICEQARRENLRLAMRASCSVALLAGSFAVLVSSDFNPFIYYRF